MARRRKGCALARRYGHQARRQAGVHPIDDLIEAQRRVTVRAPPMTEREMVAEARREREVEQARWHALREGHHWLGDRWRSMERDVQDSRTSSFDPLTGLSSGPLVDRFNRGDL